MFVVLVTSSLVVSGGIQLWASFQDERSSLSTIQRVEATAAADRIEQFVRDIERQLGASLRLVPETVPPEQRAADLRRILRQAVAVTDASYVDALGKEQARISRVALNALGSQRDRSREPAFVAARSGRTYYGPVVYRDESEPYMTIAVAERGPGGGVLIAEVDLKFIWDVVSRIRIGASGYAYVVGPQGHLLAHPDQSLVLRKTDLSSLAQVRAAIEGQPGADGGSIVGSDPGGRAVLAAAQPIDPPGWWVLVEQPLDEAFGPLYASIARAIGLLVAAIGLALVLAILFARRMVRPIHALQAGAARIGAGALDLPIEVRTGDELEMLARDFDRMRERLRESYADLERKVEQRTRELATLLDEQTATTAVLRVLASTPGDVEPVFRSILENAARLCEADFAVVYTFGDGVLTAVAHHSASPDFAQHLSRARLAPSPETPSRRAALERRPILVDDLLTDLSYSPTPAHHAERIRSVLALPMQREDALTGVITVWRQEVRPFGEPHLRLLRTFADQALIAMENVRLFRQIREKSEQLEIANRHKSQFLANMSHELRTPLNAIIGFSEVLRERMFGDLNDRQDEYVRDIVGSGRHLLALINEILDLSKVEAGRMELEVSSFSLPVALQSGLTMIRERAGAHGIVCTLDVEPDISDVQADERKVRQIVFNLLSNAVKFTPDGGRIEVSARRGDGEIAVSVRDTGMGIAPEDQARIFDEFEQTRAGGRAGEGTGLGLALTKRFVEMHGGRIWVESNVGRGSAFTFTLPLGLVPGTLSPVPGATLRGSPAPGQQMHGSPSAQPSQQ